MRNAPLMSLSALLMYLFTLTGTAAPSLLLATSQETAAVLLKQAATLLAAGHPAQAATLHMRAGDAAAAARQPDAAAAYEKAPAAFHLANDPGNEATADERMADVYLKQAGATTPAGTANSDHGGQSAGQAGEPHPARCHRGWCRRDLGTSDYQFSPRGAHATQVQARHARSQ